MSTTLSTNFRDGALVGDGGGGTVELGDGDGKLLVVTGGFIAKDGEGHGFSEKHRLLGIAAVMDAGVDTMTEADVVPKFAEFPVHGQCAKCARA